VDAVQTHIRAAETHERAAELHRAAANLHEQHAVEMTVVGTPASVRRAHRLADVERDLEHRERMQAETERRRANEESQLSADEALG
jgi:hypothetical protein